MTGRLSRILDGLQSKRNGGSNDTHTPRPHAPQRPSNTNGTPAPHDPSNPQASAFHSAPSAPASYGAPPSQSLYGNLTHPGFGGPPSSYPSTQYSPTPPTPAPSAPSAFSIQPSPFSSHTVSVHLVGQPDAPPLYSFATSRWKPQVTMIQADNHTTVGEARFSFRGSSIDLSARGQHARMERGGDSYTVEGPMGVFRWNMSPMNAAVSDLVDANGTIVAKYKWSGIPGVGGKSLELWVPCSPQFAELVMLSLVAARTINGEDMRTGHRKVNLTAGGSTGFGSFVGGSGGGGGGDCGGGGGGGGDGGGGGGGGGGC